MCRLRQERNHRAGANAALLPDKAHAEVPEEPSNIPNGLAGPSGPITIDKFNVYKETTRHAPTTAGTSSTPRLATRRCQPRVARRPQRLLRPRYDARPARRAQFRRASALPSTTRSSGSRRDRPKGVRVAKDRSDGRWKVSADLGEGRGRTSKQEISFDDGYSLFKAKSATREQIAAKYLGQEITAKLTAPLSMEKSASMKM